MLKSTDGCNYGAVITDIFHRLKSFDFCFSSIMSWCLVTAVKNTFTISPLTGTKLHQTRGYFVEM